MGVGDDVRFVVGMDDRVPKLENDCCDVNVRRVCVGDSCGVDVTLCCGDVFGNGILAYADDVVDVDVPP